MIYQQGYDELLDICKQITRHRQKLAKPKVDEVVCKRIDLNISNEDLLSHLIGESLLKRIDRKLLESKNIYVQEFDIPQIKLFYSMSEAVPFVGAGHVLANQYLPSTAAVSGGDLGVWAHQNRPLVMDGAREPPGILSVFCSTSRNSALACCQSPSAARSILAAAWYRRMCIQANS